MTKKTQTFLKWGLLGGIASASLGLVLFILNVDSSSWINYMGMAILVAVIVAGSYEYRDKIEGGFAGFKQLLGFAMMITLVYALFSSSWAIIYMEFIDTELVSRILLDTEIRMEDQGLMDEQIKQTLGVTKKMMQPHYFFFTSVMSMTFIGLLISLLSSLVLRKEKPTEVIIEEKLSA